MNSGRNRCDNQKLWQWVTLGSDRELLQFPLHSRRRRKGDGAVSSGQVPWHAGDLPATSTPEIKVERSEIHGSARETEDDAPRAAPSTEE